MPGPGHGAELRSLELAETPSGATVRLVLSRAVRPRVHDLGKGGRLYLDLPNGTRLGRQVPRLLDGKGPVRGVRVGVGEGGVVRVLLDLDDAASHALHVEGPVVALRIAPRAPPGEAFGPPPATVAPARPPVRRHAVAAPRRARPRIVLDPGHGGRDPGARGYAVEKEVTLGIARQLAALLAERLDAEVVLTRTRDATLPLSARTARANAEGADLFVSIHANSSPRRQLRGVETYVLNNTGDRATIRLAAMENGLGPRARGAGRTDLRYILSDLVQVGKMEESIALATALQRGLVTHLSRHYPDVVDLGVKRGPFYVLVGAYMPCVLVEVAFLSHPVEGRRLAGRAYREKIAEGLAAGVARFLADTRRVQTL
jgi:N-acetylmuramoyl-L-alanine amidase